MIFCNPTWARDMLRAILPPPRLAMATESELKFRIPEAALAAAVSHPVLSVLGGPPLVRRLATRYFDLPGGELAAAGMALRLRDSGGTAVFTVKVSGSGLGLHRGEWEWAAAAGDHPAPADLERALAETPLADLGLDAAALRAGLRPVFGTVFERRSWRIEWGASTVEVALDVGVCTALRDGVAVEAPIRELEIELLDGDFDACWDLAWALAQDLPLLASPVNKARRAAVLAAGARIDALPEPGPAPRDAGVGDVAAV